MRGQGGTVQPRGGQLFGLLRQRARRNASFGFCEGSNSRAAALGRHASGDIEEVQRCQGWVDRKTTTRTHMGTRVRNDRIEGRCALGLVP